MMLPYVTTTIGYGNDTHATEKSCFSKLTGLMNEQRRFFNTQIFHKSTISVNFPQNKMKICAACCEELPKEGFSSKQWKLKQYQRRCMGCIDNNRTVKLAAPPTSENEFSCHLLLLTMKKMHHRAVYVWRRVIMN